MSSLKDKKIEKVAEIKDKLEKASSFILIDYKGLTVEEDTILRNDYRESGVTYEVMKNRLLGIALKSMGYDQFDEALNGPTSVAIGSTDIAAPARIAFKKSKEYKKMTIKCGMAEGKFLTDKKCEELSKLPTKEGLLSQLLGMLQAPVASLARVINAIAEKNSEGSEEKAVEA